LDYRLLEALIVEEIIPRAEQLEKDYDWHGAAESYQKALDLLSEGDYSHKGDVTERLGYAFYRFAFQAETNEESRDRLRESTASYRKAIEFYGRLKESLKTAKTSRCNAMMAYIGYWLASEAKEKKKLIDECWRLTKEALAAFKETDEDLQYGKTYNQLSSSIVFSFCYEWDFQAREKLMRDVVEYGQQAIKSLSTLEDHRELAKAYARTAFCLGVFNYYFLDADDRQEGCLKVQDYWQKAKELSEDVALFEFLHPVFGAQFLLWGDGTEEASTNLKKALEYSRKTKDKFIIGCTLDWLVYHTNWEMSAKLDEDPEYRSAHQKTILQYAEDARQQYAPISFISPRDDALWIETIQPDYQNGLAFWETDLRKKRQLLEKAREAYPDGLRRAEASGYPEVTALAHHMFGGILVNSAQIETNSDEKKKLLEEALEHKQEAVRITEKLHPFQPWDRGVMQITLAWAKYELADLAKDPETRKSTLQEAILIMEKGLKLCIEPVRGFGFTPAAPYLIGYNQYKSGVWLNRLYELTSNKEHLREAARAFTEAAESYQKIDAKSRIAESHWKAAQIYDALGEHLKAAEDFDLASDNYKVVSERVPQLKDFYQEYACYMQAWSEIEKARHHHERQEYGLAKEYFEKAAHLHKSLKRWGYLENNYSAWAQLEHAEELSRKEQSEEAIKAFERASRLFDDTKKSLQVQLSRIEDADEKQMITSMVKASDLRREYSEGRVAVEEAKILDKKGDHLASSRKYGSAAEAFERIGKTLESEQERKEFAFIISLSRAWEKMMAADAKASPESYLEASALFEQASEESNNETTGLLALGHSRFCRALEAGTRFADTGGVALHASAIQHLESAAKYYVKAGFQSASEYARATGLLFDAYVQLDNAKKAQDPDKKAKLYAIAEKVLQTSAGFYMKAEHPEKREQVMRLLDNVREERELALSIAEVLHTPSIISTTTSFIAPTPTSEEAVGSERFEHADIQANLIIRQKELNVGEPLNLEIELVNAGKGPALLVKVNKVIPEGFELTEKPETCRIEDSYIDMKGKRLGPLKTEELKLTLKPKVQGTFALKPTVLYLDENGKYRSHEPEPVNITVKKLEIEGFHPLEVSEGTRVSTGCEDLDRLLYGGMPPSSAVVLTSPACNEKNWLIQSFLETGAKKGEVSFYITKDLGAMKPLAEEFQSNFCVFICNPQANAIIRDSANVFKMKGVESLTAISIALTSAIHKLDPSLKGPRRICIDLISDVLLQHQAVQTRRWLMSILAELKSNGFTTLAVMDPEMHSPQETRAILDLFDGEINIREKETEKGLERYLRIKKMSNQKYVENEMLLKKDQL
jgi:KaiC/GvpD/RAD55 family RecA-like ATPase